MPHKHFYEFGPFRIDVALSRLERAGEVIPIPPKAFDLLVLLARSPDRLLSKSELMQTLWPTTFVEEANLTQHVYTLRKALGDRPDGEPYIATVPRRGYRLNADVREAHGDGAVLPPAAAIEPRGEQQLAAPVVAEGERKQATVLHCSVANAASLAERLGPAGFSEAMTRFAHCAAEEISRYEGVRRRDDAGEFVALFGMRVVHEDDARRAVMAALAIAQRLHEAVPPGMPAEDHPQVRIGIDSGAVVVSRRADVRGVEYSAVGETMRIADLLCHLGEPGVILISDATRRMVEGYVELAPTPIEAAGTGAFRVLRAASAEEARPPRFARRLTPFVGRIHELALLADLAAQARDGKGQVVSLVGEPGMGKSRLMHEFAQTLSAGGAVTLLEGKCVSYGSSVPYLPLVDLIRMYCGVREGDSAERLRDAVEHTVRTAGLPAEATAWVLRLLGLVDANAHSALSPEAIKARTFDVLRTLFLKASTRTLVVILIEDVHWVDRTSEEFLTSLIERLVAVPVMLVATYRPGYRAPWIDRSYVTQITLPPLTAVDSSRLVNAVARDTPLPQSVSTAILARAEGNPFFLEELARTVIEGGREEHSIPDTVHGVIMARLDQLPDGAKQLLQTASVIGREVPSRLLTRMHRSPGFDAELAGLCRQEFLYERPGRDEPIFVFKHALTQDVAYDSLLARVRRDLHLEAAHAFEDLYAERLEEVTSTLAYHYSRTDCIDEAVTWLIRAADQAARVYANSEVILHLDLARRRLERLPESSARDRRTIDVALRHAHSLYFLGQFKASIDVLLPHEARLARLNDPALTAAFSFWLAHMYSRLGDQRRATDSANRAIEAATRAGDDATLGKAHGLLALEGHWSGNTADGITHGEEAVRLLRPKADQQWWLGMAHFYLAVNHLLTGDFEAALAEARMADRVGKNIGDPRLQTYAGFTSGWIEVSRGNADRAIGLCRRSREQAPDRVSRAYASMLLGFALLERGEHNEARNLLEPVVAELESFGFSQWHSLAATLVGEAYRRSDRLGDASAAARTGIEVATRAQYWYGVAMAERVAARVARDEGRPDEAADGFELAARTFDRIGTHFEAERTRTESASAKSPT